SRNEPCPCGSGKKYKRCRGAFNERSIKCRIRQPH
ncbi:MAG: SEC-C metal-binding domain-containing protein, partial [Planktomarina sp.]